MAYLQAKVHSMHLGPKISGVELAFPSAWRRGYSLKYNLWRMGATKSRSPHTVLLIFAPKVYANLHLWRTPETLLAYLRREVYTECTLAAGVDPELDFMGDVILSLCEQFLSTIICYRKYCRLRRPYPCPPGPPLLNLGYRA